MNRNLRRLLFALVISTMCWFGTEMLFGRNKRDGAGTGAKPVARIGESVNEVQRKPVTRIIWESVSRSDQLYPGEMVRTMASSEAKIVLEDSKAVLHLEPNSVVVLEQNENGLALDFLEGNLYVAGSGGEGSQGVTLKSGNNEIKLTSAEMSLSKDQSGQVSLEILNGQAQLQQGSKTVALDKHKSATLSATGVNVAKDSLKIESPSAGKTVLLNLSRGEKLEFTWAKLPAGYKISVESGASRRSLSMLAESTTGETGRLAVPQKPGKWFARLVAKSDDPNLPPLSSVTIPYTIEPKTRPTLVEPATDGVVLKSEDAQDVSFRWINRHTFYSQLLEVAKDPAFKTLAVRQALGPEDTEFTAKLVDGKYFWRVTGYLDVGTKDTPKHEQLSAKAQTFTVNSKWDLKPPVLLSPAHQQRLSFADVQRKGVDLKWQPPEGVKTFKVSVVRQTEKGSEVVSERDSETGFMKLSNLQPGTYIWKVASLDPKGGAPKSSEPFEFRVDELPKLEWDGDNTVFEYSTPNPSLAGQWKALTDAPVSYRYRVSPEELHLDDAEWRSTNLTSLDTPVAGEGKYLAIVEAVDAKGQTLARSDVRVFTVKPRPLLPPPQWLANTPDVLKSDAKGNLSLGWQEVDGAKNYLMVIETEDGKVIDKHEVSRSTASLIRMKPGMYQVKLKSVDSQKREGPFGEARKLTVPNTSDIKAPKIKAVKVK